MKKIPKNFRTKVNAEKYQRGLRKKGFQSRKAKTKSGYKVIKTRELGVPGGKFGSRTGKLRKQQRRKGKAKAQSRASSAFRLFG